MSATIVVTIPKELEPGILSMPHGHELNYRKDQDYKSKGAMPNILTSSTYYDPLAKTPYHKNVRVKLAKVEEMV